MTENTSVPRLIELASTFIVHECWKRGAAIEILAHYYHDIQANTQAGNDRAEHSLTRYYDAINDIIQEILSFQLPQHLQFDIGNLFLELEKDARSIAKFIISCTHSALSRDKIIHTLKSFILNPSGKIDRQMTLINVVLRSQSSTNITIKYMAYYCITKERFKKIWRESLVYSKKRFRKFDLDTIFARPEWYWQQRRRFLNMSLFICCATQGPLEAMKYFLPTLQADEREAELSRAASHLVQQRTIDAENLWFFYNTMEPSTWFKFLKRHFKYIISTMLSCHRYRLLAAHFYSQVSEIIDKEVIRSLLNHIAEQYSSDLESQPGGINLEDLLLNDLDQAFYSIWEKMPTNVRNHATTRIKQYISIFLYRDRFHLVTSLIQYEAFNDYEQLDLVYHAVMTLIVTNKQSYIEEFLNKLDHKPHLDRESIKDNYLTYYTFGHFIIAGDSCTNINNYDTLLRTKHTDSEIIHIKHQLLNDARLMNSAADAMQDLFTINNFYDLVQWCCSDDLTQENRFVAKSFNIITKVLQNHVLHMRYSFNENNLFNLTERQEQIIKSYIRQDKQSLKAYCLELITTKTYSDLTTMLSSVFENDEDRVAFLRDFFRSPSGYDAINWFISQYGKIFDHMVYYEYKFHLRATHFIEFKLHWVLTNEILEDIETILNRYVIPELEDEQDLLPHESAASYRKICVGNLQTMRAILRRSEEDFE